MEEKLVIEGIKLLAQFALLTVIGGLVSRYYAQTQKKKALKKEVLEQFAQIHGAFVSLRFKVNSLYVNWEKNRGIGTHPLKDLEEKQQLERWRFYQEACDQIGEYQSLKPLLILFFPKKTPEINQLHQYYQEWRRSIGRGEAVLQEADGSSTSRYREMKDLYLELIKYMQKRF